MSSLCIFHVMLPRPGPVIEIPRGPQKKFGVNSYISLSLSLSLFLLRAHFLFNVFTLLINVYSISISFFLSLFFAHFIPTPTHIHIHTHNTQTFAIYKFTVACLFTRSHLIIDIINQVRREFRGGSSSTQIGI